MKIRLKSSKRLRPRVKVRIKRAFRNLEQAFLKASKEVLQDINLSFLAQAEKIITAKDLGAVSSLDLDFSKFQNILFNYLRECRRTGRFQGITEGLELMQFYQKRQKARKKLDQGIDHAVDDVIQSFIGELSFDNKIKASSFAVVPYDALKYYNDYSLFLTGDIESDLLKKAKQKIYSGIENGLSVRNIMADLEPVFPAFSSGRLQNIARTETSRAMNQGRLEGFKAPALDGFIVAVEFTAILDSRVSDICEARDGLIIGIDDPRLQANIPPLHFQCRSVLVPVDKYSLIEEALEDRVGEGWDSIQEPMKGFGGTGKEIKQKASTVKRKSSPENIPVTEEIYNEAGIIGGEIKNKLEKDFGVKIDAEYIYTKTKEEFDDYLSKYNYQKRDGEEISGLYKDGKIIISPKDVVYIAQKNIKGIKTFVHENIHAIGKSAFVEWEFLDEGVTELLTRKWIIDNYEDINIEDLEAVDEYEEYCSDMLLQLIVKYKGNKEVIYNKLKDIRKVNKQVGFQWAMGFEFTTDNVNQEKYNNTLNKIKKYGILEEGAEEYLKKHDREIIEVNETIKILKSLGISSKSIKDYSKDENIMVIIRDKKFNSKVILWFLSKKQ